MSEIIIKVEDKKLEFFDNLAFSTQIDSVSSSLSFDSFYDIKTYEFAKIEVTRNNILIFTGKIFGKTKPNEVTSKPFNYKCYSLTGILEDSTLPLSLFPLQTQDKTAKEIIQKLCNYFEITLKIDSSANSDLNKVYELKDQSPDTKAIDIINELCSQNNLIVSHNASGNLLITKTLGSDSELKSNVLQSNKNYNYRKFFRSYVVLGQQSISSDTTRKAESLFKTIDTKRNTIKIQKDGDSEISQKQADALKYDSYKSNTFSIELNDNFINVGSKFIIDNTKVICNSVTYNYKAGSETCSISLLNYKVYER